MRRLRCFAQNAKIARGKADLIERDEALFAIENTHHDLFAVVRGEGRYAKIDRTVVDGRGKAAILRLTLLIEANT